VVCGWADSGEAMSAARATPIRIILIGASPGYEGGHAAFDSRIGKELSIFPFLEIFDLLTRHERVFSSSAHRSDRVRQKPLDYKKVCSRRE
jgi:hypothetical protein